MDFQLFLKQQNNQDTDCSFVFKKKDGTVKEIIHAHKLVLSTIPYFETNFKSEWSGNDPIWITVCKSSVFKQFIQSLYIRDVSFKTTNEAMDLYEVAHFYQAEDVLDAIRAKFNFSANRLSRVINTALKYQDFVLMQKSSAYFSGYANYIFCEKDFLRYSIDAVNFLYNADRITATNERILEALESYVTNNKITSLKVLKPAISAIRFLALPKERILNTVLLTEVEKNSLFKKNSLDFVYLSTKLQPEKRFGADEGYVPTIEAEHNSDEVSEDELS